MVDDLMLGERGLSRLEREMIAVAVSAINHCHYCLTAHGAAVRYPCAFGRTVTVKIKFADFRQITRSRSFSAVVTCQDHLRQASLDLVRSVFPPEKGIRLAGVTVSNFEQRYAENELPLFGAHTSLFS